MNLTQKPELLDRLAAAYALGSLRGGARRRFEQLAREYAQVRAAALLWQGRWSAFSESRSRCSPMQRYGCVSTTCCRLKKPMQSWHSSESLRQQSGPTRALAWWRGLAVARQSGDGGSCLRGSLAHRHGTAANVFAANPATDRKLRCRRLLRFNTWRCWPMARQIHLCW